MFMRALPLFLLVFLAACSSGGDSMAPPGNPPGNPPAATAPAITTQPAAVSVAAGQSATFSVAASGTAPFAYQWRRNGADIPGATASTYVAPAVAAGDSGASYTVVITNATGSVTSAGAVLTVTLPSGSTSEIEVDQTTALLTTIGATAQLGARPVDGSGAPIAGAVTWESSKPSEVSVDASGRITAHAIGSAMLFAQANGKRSQPIFVVVAEPVPGALVLTDAQIVAVGAPIGLAADAMAEIGTRFEVTVSGLATPPAPGTAVLAAGDAQVAGKVVSSRSEAGNLVLLLELAPLPQLLARYDLDWDIDLSTLPVDDIQVESGMGPVMLKRNAFSLGNATQAADEGFQNFKCEGEFGVTLVSTKISLTPQLNAHLTVQTSRDDPTLTPGYAKVALTGSQGLKGTASILVNPGFTASVECIAQAQVKIPVGGAVSLLVMPALRLGMGFSLEGAIVATKGELKLSGMVGMQETLGFECQGGVSNACRSLSDVTLIDDFKLTKEVPTLNGMHVTLDGQVFALAGIDAVFLLGVANAEIVEARVGPKQEFELATADTQAKNAGMASNYKLSLDGVIQPGKALKDALKKLIDDSTVTLNFSIPFSTPLAESPKGSLDVSHSNVAYGTAVDFQVHLTDPVTYPLLGDSGETRYNVDHVIIYRKKQGEPEFTEWHTFPTREGQTTFQYEWTPTSSDMGDYEFAAFTETLLPVPVLEVAPNSIKRLHVRGPGWSGSITFTLEGEENVEENNSTPEGSGRTSTIYTDSGSGQMLLETFVGAFGEPILQVTDGNGTVSRSISMQASSQYRSGDCQYTMSGTSESVERGTLRAPELAFVSIQFNGDGTYQLLIPTLQGPTIVNTHSQGSGSVSGHPSCRLAEPHDTTTESQGNFSTKSMFVKGTAEANATTLAGTAEVVVTETTPDHKYTVSWNLRKH